MNVMMRADRILVLRESKVTFGMSSSGVATSSGMLDILNQGCIE
jgi:hypothetical protein